MKNQIARFIGGPLGSPAAETILGISLHQGKTNLKITVRHRTPDETKVGCQQWFDLAEEADAHVAYDKLCDDALTKGWTATNRRRRKPTFTEIPKAPNGDDPVTKRKK